MWVEDSVSPRPTLEAYGAEGDYIRIAMWFDGRPSGHVHWYSGGDAVNSRAFEAVAALAGVHLRIPGPAILTELEPSWGYGLVARLSRKEL